MKNKILYLLLLMASLLQGCVQDVDDLFDTSASERMSQALKDYRSLLSSSENGWLMEYYPSDIQEYGGYAIAMKFDVKDNVTVWGGLSGEPNLTASSLYSLKSDMGPTLNFDTYNSILHYFSDPDNTDGGGQGLAFEGDYEFIFQSHTQDSIVLKGKKTKNMIRMIRLQESPEAYLAKSMAVSRDFADFKGILGFGGTVDGKELMASITNSPYRYEITYNGETTKAPFMCIPSGIQLYKPLKIGTKTLYRFNWSAANETLTAETDPAVVLKIVPDPEYPPYAQYLGTYTMKYTGYSGNKSIQIELIQKVYKQSYTIKGMSPINYTMMYNPIEQRMELLNQKLTNGSGAYLSVWNVSPGNLEFGGSEYVKGLYSTLKQGTTNEYVFLGTEKIGDALIRGLILWSSAGEYRALGESRFADITMIKN